MYLTRLENQMCKQASSDIAVNAKQGTTMQAIQVSNVGDAKVRRYNLFSDDGKTQVLKTVYVVINGANSMLSYDI